MASHGPCMASRLSSWPPIILFGAVQKLAGKSASPFRFTALPDLRDVNQWLRQLPWVARLGFPGGGGPFRQCHALGDEHS